MKKLTPMKREILQAAKAGPLFRNVSGYSRAGARRFPTAPVRELVEAGCLTETSSRSGTVMVILNDVGREAIGEPLAKRRPVDDEAALSLHHRIAP